MINEHGRTDTESLFTGCDACVSPYRQEVITVTQDIIATLTVYSYVMSKKGKEIKAAFNRRKLNIPNKKEESYLP